MTLTQLRYFLALSDRLHFNQTAELLYISQPSLTQHISKLEKELGVSLFQRNSDGLTLTPAGIVMQREVRVILDRLDVLVRSLKDPAAFSSVPATFRIVIDDYTFTHEPIFSAAFVSAIQDLNQTYPLTEVRTDSVLSGREYRRRLYDGSTDLCLGMLEEPGDANLECVHFGSQNQYLAIPGNFPLARTGNRERLAEYLNRNDLFMADFDHRMEVKTLDYLLEKGISTNLHFMNNVMQILLAVRLGKGAAVIPEHRLMPDIFGDIQLVPLPELAIRRYLVWNKASTTPLLPRFVESFLSEIERQKTNRQTSEPPSPETMIRDW